MTARIRIIRAGPLTSIQDAGRFGVLRHGISASGPMDRQAHAAAGLLAGARDAVGIEFTMAGLELELVEGQLELGWAGGQFRVRINGNDRDWPGRATLEAGDRLGITPGPQGNYGYLRFGAHVEVPEVMGSVATSTRARLGGMGGRALMAGDRLEFSGHGTGAGDVPVSADATGPIRFVWGIHAERFSPALRQKFADAEFRVTAGMDRMGVRLDDVEGVFAGATILSLVSDPILPGDIQILGDGTPIVLMRDHQPTGGYPRIGTVISADLDRFAQLRPGSAVAFAPVSVEHAHRLLRSAK